MSKVRVKLFFSGPSIKRPLVYELGHKFDLITNIRRAVSYTHLTLPTNREV